MHRHLGVVDYSVNNISSVGKALQRLDIPFDFVKDGRGIQQCSHVILPGVGSFDEGSQNLHTSDLATSLRKFASSGGKLLGICLGLQLLFERSDESAGDTQGLSILPGTCRRLPSNTESRILVPHMGWNPVDIRADSTLLSGIDNLTEFYFLHSYYVAPVDNGIVSAECLHGMRFPAAIEMGNVFGTQFHPEKCFASGLQIINNFVNVT